jgi:hypothetical protein
LTVADAGIDRLAQIHEEPFVALVTTLIGRYSWPPIPRNAASTHAWRGFRVLSVPIDAARRAD